MSPKVATRKSSQTHRQLGQQDFLTIQPILNLVIYELGVRPTMLTRLVRTFDGRRLWLEERTEETLNLLQHIESEYSQDTGKLQGLRAFVSGQKYFFNLGFELSAPQGCF